MFIEFALKIKKSSDRILSYLKNCSAYILKKKSSKIELHYLRNILFQKHFFHTLNIRKQTDFIFLLRFTKKKTIRVQQAYFRSFEYKKQSLKSDAYFSRIL